MTAVSPPGSRLWPAANTQYIYTAGQDNGRVAQTIDGVLGETVNYSYDMWNRLTSATATNGSWGEQYTFDYFGNRAAKTPTAGSAPSMSVPYNAATNQPTGASFDANGNPAGTTWNVENRLTLADPNGQATGYSYDPWGRRVWKQVNNSVGSIGEVYFYGATGQKLETYGFTEGTNMYFGGKLLQSKGVWVATDRLGSVRANSNLESMSYFPYGEERTATADDREKFATYTRDAPGQDYALARYYSGSIGAFWNPDPGGITTATPNNPLSWNRYAYGLGDAIKNFDPTGNIACDTRQADCAAGGAPTATSPIAGGTQTAMATAVLGSAAFGGALTAGTLGAPRPMPEAGDPATSAPFADQASESTAERRAQSSPAGGGPSETVSPRASRPDQSADSHDLTGEYQADSFFGVVVGCPITTSGVLHQMLWGAIGGAVLGASGGPATAFAGAVVGAGAAAIQAGFASAICQAMGQN